MRAPRGRRAGTRPAKGRAAWTEDLSPRVSWGSSPLSHNVDKRAVRERRYFRTGSRWLPLRVLGRPDLGPPLRFFAKGHLPSSSEKHHNVSISAGKWTPPGP